MITSPQHKIITDFDVYYFETGYEEDDDEEDDEQVENADEPRRLTSRD